MPPSLFQSDYVQQAGAIAGRLALPPREGHYDELRNADGALVTSGLYGWTMVVTGVGATAETARREAYDRAARVVLPNVRYRLDIGRRLIDADHAELEALGLLS